MRRSIGSLAVAMGFAVVGCAGAASAATVLDVTTNWPARTGLPTYCKDQTQRRFVIQGPGRLTETLTLTPYRSAGKIGYIPIVWTLYKPDGSNTGWATEPFAGYQGAHWYVGGREVHNAVEGAPLEIRTTYNLDARRYDVGVVLPAPCQSFGGGGFAQFAQGQHLVLDFQGAGPSTPPVSTPPVSTAPTPPSNQPARFFDNGNAGSVANAPTAPTTVRLGAAMFLSRITDYHWNNGAGAPAGTIALRDSAGRVYGPWQSTLQGKAYWTATPNVVLPAGTYVVVDSDRATWSQNAASGGAGMSWLEGYPAR